MSEHDALAVLETIARERDSICAVGEVGLPWYGERAQETRPCGTRRS